MSSSSIPADQAAEAAATPETLVSPTAPRRESWWHWRPTSGDQCGDAERAMLAPVKGRFSLRKVAISCAPEPAEAAQAENKCGNNTGADGAAEESRGSINTLVMGSGPPLVLLHGMAAGIGLWVGNLDALAEHFTVYAIDMPGFARSDRFPFSGNNVKDGEDFFIGHIEAWRKAVGLNSPFTLVGHSMGGYLSAVYAMRHPDKVKHLVLADPWGIPSKPPGWESKMKWQWRLAGSVLTKFNPLAVVRVAGPWGPDLLTKFRKDIAEKFERVFHNNQVVLDYIYHCNAQEPTGEAAFSALTEGLAWAKEPLLARLPGGLRRDMPVSMLYGSHTWMDKVTGRNLAEQLGQARATFHLVADSGHHVYIDNKDHFNSLVIAEALRHAR